MADRSAANDGLVDADVVGQLLSLKPAYVLRLAREDQIPHLRIGPKYVRFERDAVLAWASSLRRGGGDTG